MSVPPPNDSLPPSSQGPSDVDRDAGGRRAEGAKATLTEGLRKAIQTGANVLFTSEEGGKKPLGELRLPKEAMQFLYSQVERGRKDLFRSARHEMRRMIDSMDMRGEVRKALVGLRVQVKAEITFTEDDTQVQVVENTIGHSGKTPKEGARSAGGPRGPAEGRFTGQGDAAPSDGTPDSAATRRRRPRSEP